MKSIKINNKQTQTVERGPIFSSSTNNLAHAQTLSRMSSLSGRMNIGRVNIEFFTGWKKIKRARLLTHDIIKNSTAIYLYGFINQSLGLVLGNIFFFIIKITVCMPLKNEILFISKNCIANVTCRGIFICSAS
jgi:hypothetical protein